MKELADGMGGTVEVHSVPDRLTRFTVRLPAGTPDLAEADELVRG